MNAFKAKVAEDKTAPTFSNSLGDLKKEYRVFDWHGTTIW